MFEDATHRVFALRTNANNWKGTFGRLFGAVAYFSSLASHGKPEPGAKSSPHRVFRSSSTKMHTRIIVPSSSRIFPCGLPCLQMR